MALAYLSYLIKRAINRGKIQMLSKVRETIDQIKELRINFERSAEIQLKVWKKEKTKNHPLLLHCDLDDAYYTGLPVFNMKEIHYDLEKMFVSQVRGMMTAAYGGLHAVPSVRANMGCGIFATLLGVAQELYEDKMPWVQKHLSKEQLVMMEPDDLKIGPEFKMGLDHIAYMAEQLEGTGCLIYPMDVQGPFDIAHLVYGDALFYDIYDDPKFVHHLLELSCHAIFKGMEACFKYIPNSGDIVAHYNGLVMPRSIGGIKTSEDTSTLLSKEHIEEYVVPYLHKVLTHFGGGYVHYCGKNPHLFEAVMNIPNVRGINFGNPEKHDMEDILRRCADVGKVYYGNLPQNEGETAKEYFSKYLKASKSGDKSLLLLNYNCKKNDQAEIIEAWNCACNKILV